MNHTIAIIFRDEIPENKDCSKANSSRSQQSFMAYGLQQLPHTNRSTPGPVLPPMLDPIIRMQHRMLL
jgi:hypothetical protein